MSTKFPTFMYVKEEQAGGDEAFFVAGPTAEEHAETDEVEVAEYQLVRVNTLRLVPTIISERK